jgi:putative restriction endonuclease
MPFSKINHSNVDVKALAAIIGRSPNSVALKLANFARLDPALKKRNVAGMSHGSKGEVEIWDEFHADWDALAFQSEEILAGLHHTSVENTAGISTVDLPKEGREREAVVRTRVNQAFLRKTILASYDFRCCITGIQIPELLIASHIVPWSDDLKNGVNPCNGLCMNALHDRAFDCGLMTVTTDLVICYSRRLKNAPSSEFFAEYNNKKISAPNRFAPKKEFLEYHNKKIFRNN